MPTLEESVEAVRSGAREDRFTYLTVLEYHVRTPGVLPVLNEVLQNEDLTQDIGWDLVDMLLPVDGYEACLETVARLGNPKEVYLRVTQALGGLAAAWLVEDDDDGVAAAEGGHHKLRIRRDGSDESSDYQKRELLPKDKIPGAFIALLGMLAVLHGRLKAKYPSRFLGPALLRILQAYRPTPEMTASVINLVRSLSGRKRPPLPSRTSSINVANPDEDGDNSRNAPDPEAELEEPEEELKQGRLLQSFVTWVLHQYVEENPMRWSPRLLERYNPERNVPGKKTNIDAYRENEELQKRDAVVGQLVSLSLDLGLDQCPASFVKRIYGTQAETEISKTFEDFNNASADVQLSPGGSICLIAYWLFSADVFAAQHPEPVMHIFPDHLRMFEEFVSSGNPSEAITTSAGLADALLAIGLGLEHRGLIVAPGSGGSVGEEPPSAMAYHHHLSLILLFHPDIQVRNAATALAGTVFHGFEPDPAKRFEILEDLFVNCDFAPLKACAVQWLKEEMISTRKAGAGVAASSSSSSTTAPSQSTSNPFTSPDNLDRLQHYIFPDLTPLSGSGSESQSLPEFWAANGVFLLQAANFAYFLFAGFREALPSGMGAAVEHRFADPLIAAAAKLKSPARTGDGAGPENGEGEEGLSTLGFAVDRLRDVQFH